MIGAEPITNHAPVLRVEADGEVVMASAYNGRLYNAIFKENKPFVIVWDGQVWDLDLWGIPRGSDGGETAWEFIKWAMSPELMQRMLTEKGYGYADVAKKIRMDPEVTKIRPGSTSKLFTWTAVMQLVEQGKLDGWASARLTQ